MPSVKLIILDPARGAHRYTVPGDIITEPISFDRIVIGEPAPVSGPGDVQLLDSGTLVMKPTTTPAAAAGYGKFYGKADDKLYYQDTAGVEHDVLLDEADFADGGEANGVNRTLGNTDAYSLGFLTNNVVRLSLAAGGDVDVTTGNLSVTTGNVDIVSGTLDVAGNVTVDTGNVDIVSGTLDVAGDVTVDTGNVAVTSGLIYTGAAPIANQGDVQLLNSGVLAMKETTTPTADLGHGKLYCKSDNTLYFLDATGAEHTVSIDIKSQFENGGEAGGADRTLGNTDAYSLGFLTTGIVRVSIAAGGDVSISTGNFTVTAGNLIMTAGDVQLGANGIGNDNPVLTFDAGAAGTATFTGGAIFGADIHVGADEATAAAVHIYGDSATTGGLLRLYNASGESSSPGGSTAFWDVEADYGLTIKDDTGVVLLEVLPVGGIVMGTTLDMNSSPLWASGGIGADNVVLSFGVGSTGTAFFGGSVSISAGGKLLIVDSAVTAPFNVTERAAPPSTPIAGDIYLDDGTNTASTLPGWRRYTGAVWEDIAASGGGGGDFADGGEAGGANRSLGNTDAFSLSLLTSGIARIGISSTGLVGISAAGTAAAPSLAIGSATGGDTGLFAPGSSILGVSASGGEVCQFSRGIGGTDPQILLQDGNVNYPAYSFSSDGNSGMRYSAGTLYFTLGGADYVSVDTTYMTVNVNIDLSSSGLIMGGSSISFDSGSITLFGSAGVATWSGASYLDLPSGAAFSWNSASTYIQENLGELICGGVSAFYFGSGVPIGETSGGVTLTFNNGIPGNATLANGDFFIGSNGIGNDAQAITFANSLGGNHASFYGNIYLAGGIGVDAAVLTFNSGASGAATFGGNVYAVNFGLDAATLTFTTGVTGSATFGGNVYLGTNGLGRDAAVLTFATGATGLATFAGSTKALNLVEAEGAATATLRATRTAGAAVDIIAGASVGQVRTTTSGDLELGSNSTSYLFVDPNGNVILGAKAQLAQAATNGFSYIPEINNSGGAPSGTPTSVTGKVPMCFGVTSNTLYIYANAAWRTVALT